MILSDFDLMNFINSKRLEITPFDPVIVRENGVDLRITDEVAVRNETHPEGFVFDPDNPEHMKEEYIVSRNKTIIVKQKSQVLLSTKEYIKMPDNLVGFVELRSTWARHGLVMPPTIIDAGFAGNITLEIFNSSPYAIKLKPDTRFAHVIFSMTMNRVEKAYSGRYFGQRGLTPPKPL